MNSLPFAAQIAIVAVALWALLSTTFLVWFAHAYWSETQQDKREMQQQRNLGDR